MTQILIKKRKSKGKYDIVHTKYGDAKILYYRNFRDVDFMYMDTGNIIRGARMDRLLDNDISDNLRPSEVTYGYLGINYDNGKSNNKCNDKFYRRSYNIWHNMLDRCNNVRSKDYDNYGGRGVTICPRWHDFSLFMGDLIKLPGYDYDKFIGRKISLDKDKLANNINKCYSPETCCMLTSKEQIQYIDVQRKIKDRVSKFIAYHPDGSVTVETNASQFARDHGLSSCKISNCLTGSRKSHKGFKFEIQ
jgi:hypothetical protein